MWQAQVFTLYPEFFPGPLSKGLYGKALSKKLWNLNIINIRDAAEDKHKTVDDTPYGGGSGMLLKADVLAKSLDKNKNIVIGFGITEKTIKSLKKADGLVVGSAICKEITNSINKRQNAVTNVTNIVRKLRNKIK